VNAIAGTLTHIGMLLWVAGAACTYVLPRQKAVCVSLALATGSLLCYTVSAILADDTPIALLEATFTGVAAWAWWTRGGGDGTKRRLRRLRARFRAVRRTAPVTT